MKKDNKNHKKVIVTFITILLILDQITKIICYQKGMASSISGNAEENNGYYIIMSIIVVIMILRYIGSNNLFIKLGTKVILSFAIVGMAFILTKNSMRILNDKKNKKLIQEEFKKDNDEGWKIITIFNTFH